MGAALVSSGQEETEGCGFLKEFYKSEPIFPL